MTIAIQPVTIKLTFPEEIDAAPIEIKSDHPFLTNSTLQTLNPESPWFLSNLEQKEIPILSVSKKVVKVAIDFLNGEGLTNVSQKPEEIYEFYRGADFFQISTFKNAILDYADKNTECFIVEEHVTNQNLIPLESDFYQDILSKKISPLTLPELRNKILDPSNVLSYVYRFTNIGPKEQKVEVKSLSSTIFEMALERSKDPFSIRKIQNYFPTNTLTRIVSEIFKLIFAVVLKHSICRDLWDIALKTENFITNKRTLHIYNTTYNEILNVANKEKKFMVMILLNEEIKPFLQEKNKILLEERLYLKTKAIAKIIASIACVVFFLNAIDYPIYFIFQEIEIFFPVYGNPTLIKYSYLFAIWFTTIQGSNLVYKGLKNLYSSRIFSRLRTDQ